ncbi:type II and III secretion system protein family protein [Methylobacterium oryzihabitans]|uniref:Type II and III secretion system protein family protein n=1 Tax=Methylobacterium oryzihabitans TaxID=2499852 RepID=A0A3S2V521_9HYPH|nr:type II and III secretion system protein family protein [Methylobacterium oryzihabitans]RVU13747.1 type II and III secretion system protein family protein [Methylobacterium oryzihabitans]
MPARVPAPSRARSALLPLLAAAAVLAGSPLPVLGQPAGMRGAVAPAPVLAVGPDEAAISRRLDLTQGRSVVVDLPRDAREVFVANPKVANAVVRSTRKVFVIGVDNGATSIFVMDAEGRQIAALDVTVGRDLNVLRQTLNGSLPGGRFDVRPAGESVLLTGTVTSAAEAQQAVDIATAFVGTNGGARGAVINNLTIRGRDQVMLRVTVVEVSRSVLKQFGINTSSTWGITKNFANNTPFPLSGQSFPTGNLVQGSIGAGPMTLQATLRAFEQAGVSRILAEPTLTAISGEAANFTAGGEIPVPTSQNCTGIVGVVGVGGSSNCSVGIEFKPYGVALNFTPVVQSENRISVRVGTNVTELDPQNAILVSNGNTSIAVPALTVRKSETTIELPSGGTMMTAGLIQQRTRQAIDGLPGLVNLPVLGALFRSRDYQRQETELMIMVTPYIARPMDPGEAKRPDDGFVDATDAQSILLGRFNRLYGVVGAAPLGPAYRGRVGFITD